MSLLFVRHVDGAGSMVQEVGSWLARHLPAQGKVDSSSGDEPKWS